MVSSGSVGLLVICVWALGPHLPGSQNSFGPIPSLSIDGLPLDGARMKNRPSPTMTLTRGQATLPARSREQSTKPSPTSAPKSTADTSRADTASERGRPVPARTAPAPGHASTPEVFPPTTGRPNTPRGNPTVKVPATPTAAPTCGVKVQIRTVRDDQYLLVLSVTNTGTTPLKAGWTTTVTLPSGHTVVGVQNADADLSRQPIVKISGVSRNQMLDPGVTTRALLVVSGDAQEASGAVATCSAG